MLKMFNSHNVIDEQSAAHQDETARRVGELRAAAVPPAQHSGIKHKERNTTVQHLRAPRTFSLAIHSVSIPTPIAVVYEHNSDCIIAAACSISVDVHATVMYPLPEAAASSRLCD
jgi:hypothetical protein